MPPTKPTDGVFDLFDSLKDLEKLRKEHSFILETLPEIFADDDLPVNVDQEFMQAQYGFIQFRDQLLPLLKDPRINPFEVNHILQEVEKSLSKIASQQARYKECKDLLDSDISVPYAGSL